MVRVPKLIVIGAARSGTTALYEHLRCHPQMFLSSSKEANYFAFEGEALDYRGPGADFVNNSVRTWDAYLKLFADAPKEAVIGDISPLYLYAPTAAERIRARLPDARLVAVLRNPIEQAFSHYQYARARMIEPLDSFDAAIDAEPSRLRDHWQPLFQYSEFPRYAEQIRRYQAHFPPGQLKIFLYEDFRSDPYSVLREIFGFVGVDASFEPTQHKDVNAGGDPRSRLLQAIIMKPNPLGSIAALFLPLPVRRRIRDRVSSHNVAPVTFPPTAKARLAAKLRKDILELQELLGRDLSGWLEGDFGCSSVRSEPNEALATPAQKHGRLASQERKSGKAWR